MYNEWFSHMNKSLQNAICFSHKVQMVQEKINLYPNLSIYSFTSRQNIKDENINNQ